MQTHEIIGPRTSQPGEHPINFPANTLADVMERPPTPPPGYSTLHVAADEPSGSQGPYGASKPVRDSVGAYPNLKWNSRDPRTSSTQSLVSSAKGSAAGDQRRTLLVVYIHGFMGNNSSFRSFPAHVHSLLKSLLAESHSIHTKIYPRYKTYKSIDVACENFSKWLAPHESPTTDVILVGHSMGGLLAGEVALLVGSQCHQLLS
jgi:pimeloyl-ACP methyl ester carboxylesterase